MPARRLLQRRSRDSAPGHLRSLLTDYVACPRAARPRNFLEFVRQRNPHVFSHHDPAQPDFREHVWNCRGLWICRGCTTVILTSVLSLVIGLSTRWPVQVSATTVAVCFVVLLLVSLAPLPTTRRTLLHDLRRAALGCLLGSAATYVILTDDWTGRLIVIGVYLAVLAGRAVGRGIRATGGP